MSQYEPGSEGLLMPIRPWLDDPLVSEILMNKPEEIWVEKEGALLKYEVPDMTHAHMNRLFQLIANENNQRLSQATPLLSGSLKDGSRVQICLAPTAKYPTFSIRRKVVRNLNLQSYADSGFYSEALPFSLGGIDVNILPDYEKRLIELYKKQQWDQFIKEAISHKKNIVISGGTSSGKTTYLGSCLSHIDHSDRVIILEDTRELETPHMNQVQLLASKGDQGEAKVSMQDLVQCCLRLRPDRIIMGEIRGKEIMDFVSACSTGHEGSLTSIHANNPRIAFMRMTQMYKLNNVPSMTDGDILRELKEVIDIVIQIAKTPNGRKVQSVYYRYGLLGDTKEEKEILV
jgi:type IV secretion system protein VirB11